MTDKDGKRPASVKEKERFSSGGKRWMLLLRGKWGLAIDKVLVWTTGYSLMTAQYCWALGERYGDTLMLTTVGARSGELRRACLPFFRVGNDLVVRGSNGGGGSDPAWVHNIRAHPQAWVRVHRKSRPVRAHLASGEERQKLFEILSAKSASTITYQKMCAPRELPLVVLRDWGSE